MSQDSSRRLELHISTVRLPRPTAAWSPAYAGLGRSSGEDKSARARIRDHEQQCLAWAGPQPHDPESLCGRSLGRECRSGRRRHVVAVDRHRHRWIRFDSRGVLWRCRSPADNRAIPGRRGRAPQLEPRHPSGSTRTPSPIFGPPTRRSRTSIGISVTSQPTRSFSQSQTASSRSFLPHRGGSRHRQLRRDGRRRSDARRRGREAQGAPPLVVDPAVAVAAIFALYMGVPSWRDSVCSRGRVRVGRRPTGRRSCSSSTNASRGGVRR